MNRKLMAVVCTGALVLTATSGAGMSVASAPLPAAHDPVQNYPEYEPMIAAYLRTYPKMTRAQAVRAVDTAGARAQVEVELTKNEATGYGGSWYDPPTDTVHINIVDAAAKAAAEALARSHGLRTAVHTVQYSIRELQALADSINLGVGPIPGARQAAVDPRTASVQVTVDKAELVGAQAAVLRATGGPLSAVRLLEAPAKTNATGDVCTDRLNCGKPARAGVVIWHQAGSSHVNSCSAGFTARTRSGTTSRWLITAAHCVSGIGQVWGHGGQYYGPVRAFAGEPMLNIIDYARIRIDNPYWTTGGYMFSESTAAPDHNVVLDNVAPWESFLRVGESACLNAWHGAICGVLEGTQPVYGFKWQVNVDGCAGDSGGGWYWPGGGTFGRVAYGIHSASLPDGPCNPRGPGNSFFSSVPVITQQWDQLDAIGARLRFESRCTQIDTICYW